jgi:hypothetical protein
MHSDWRCADHGAVPPLHVAKHVGSDILDVVCKISRVPVWCPWPLPPGWVVSGAGWAGDERTGASAALVACSGPAPLGGPADVILISEEPGVGLGCRFAGLPGMDPGPALETEVDHLAAHAKLVADGRPTPLWAVPCPEDRSAYVGEAKGIWLYAISHPAEAAYVLAEHIVLTDLTGSIPSELVYGALSPYLES